MQRFAHALAAVITGLSGIVMISSDSSASPAGYRHGSTLARPEPSLVALASARDPRCQTSPRSPRCGMQTRLDLARKIDEQRRRQLLESKINRLNQLKLPRKDVAPAPRFRR